ncbi:probable PGU1-Endo-polygalacturonase [Sporisorium scitamineum]|uniref:endo-polygalacturonase n=1 Tax=Sporisorium scitamineum TaxID=49012 RepID=A0A127Z9U3_9BASI|nr:probable PGU1-Endo-polygalacturonase [Sporisorium scitamineum]
MIPGRGCRPRSICVVQFGGQAAGQVRSNPSRKGKPCTLFERRGSTDRVTARYKSRVIEHEAACDILKERLSGPAQPRTSCCDDTTCLALLACLLLSLGAEQALAASCTFTDAASAKAGKTSCSTITLSNIKVPAGQTLDLTGLSAGTQVVFTGTTTFGYAAWSGPLISVSSKNIDVSGASGTLIDGGRAQWWDGKGSNGGVTKPKLFYAHGLTNSKMRSLNIKNTPVKAFSIKGCTNRSLDHITMDNSAGNENGLGHNTDAFDVDSSNGVLIANATVRNQDDCLAINSGTNILFCGGYCSGGHGLSIGSVGGRSDNTVDGVRIENSQVVNSQKAVRIKTVSGATGLVNNVTYANINLSGISKFGIDIQQDYLNGGPTGTPTNGVKVANIVMNGIKGSVSSDATRIYLLCGQGSCSNWKWSGVSISGGKSSTKCSDVPSPAQRCHAGQGKRMLFSSAWTVETSFGRRRRTGGHGDGSARWISHNLDLKRMIYEKFRA